MRESDIKECISKGAAINQNLQREEGNLSELKEGLQKSSQLTKNMQLLLMSFEGRLAKLEATILPVYNETANLQLRQCNIEQTLTALDRVIGFFNVTQEAKGIIRSGPSSALVTYIQVMDKVEEAIKYFEQNNPHNTELSNLQLLYEQGSEQIEREFRLTLHRFSKPQPPVMILDMISDSEEDFDVSLAGEEERYLQEQLPPQAVEDLTIIANWLMTHHKDDYNNVYASIRTNILQRSLQGLKDHHKSLSGSSNVLSASASIVPSSPGVTRAILSVSGKDTPSRKTSRKIQQVLKKRATAAGHTLMKYSQSVEQTTGLGLTLGHRRQGSSHELSDECLDSDVEIYILLVSALFKLLHLEVRLMSGIIHPSHQKAVFERITAPTFDLVTSDGDAIVHRAQRLTSRHEYSAALSVFPVIRHLGTTKPEFDTLLKDCHVSIKAKIPQVLLALQSTGARLLEDYVEHIKSDAEKHMPRDGTVHEQTSNAMMFLEQLVECADAIGAMLEKDQSYQHSLLNVTKEEDRPRVAVAVYIVRVLSALGLSLNTKSESYTDPYLKAVFRLNNLHYILKSLQRSGFLAIVSLYSSELEDHYNDQILEQKRLYSQSWSRVLHYIMEVDRPLPSNIHTMPKLKDKDRQNIKDKFTGFNKEIDDLYRVQKGYAIPDTDLREGLKKDNKDFIIPKYHEFYDKYISVPFTKNPEKYIRNTPAAISDLLDKFFDVTA